MHHRICTYSGISPWSLLRRPTWALCQVLWYLNAAGSSCTQNHFCFWFCNPSLPSGFSVVTCCTTSQRTLLLKQLPCKHSLSFVSQSIAIGNADLQCSLKGEHCSPPISLVFSQLLLWIPALLIPLLSPKWWLNHSLHCRVLPLLGPYCEGGCLFSDCPCHPQWKAGIKSLLHRHLQCVNLSLSMTLTHF